MEDGIVVPWIVMDERQLLDRAAAREGERVGEA
jgi:hypothetical protein